MWGPVPTIKSFVSGFASRIFGNAWIRVGRFFSGATRPTWSTTSFPFRPHFVRMAWPEMSGRKRSGSTPVGITSAMCAVGDRSSGNREVLDQVDLVPREHREAVSRVVAELLRAHVDRAGLAHAASPGVLRREDDDLMAIRLELSPGRQDGRDHAVDRGQVAVREKRDPHMPSTAVRRVLATGLPLVGPETGNRLRLHVLPARHPR